MSSWVYDNDPEEGGQIAHTSLENPAERDGVEERVVIIYEGSENTGLNTEYTTQNQRDTAPQQACYNKRSFIAVSLSLSLLCHLLLAGITTLGLLSLKLQQENVKYVQKHDQLNRERFELGNFCKDGCRSYNQSFYYISTEKKTWEESQHDCRNRGADLIIIDSKEEQFVGSLNQNYFWIGLSGIEGIWKWVNGSISATKSDWVRWDRPSAHKDKNCILTYLYRSTHYWENYACNTYSRWICEKNTKV